MSPFPSISTQAISKLVFPSAAHLFGKAMVGKGWAGMTEQSTWVSDKSEHCHYFHVRGWVNYKIWFLIWRLSEEVQGL